MRALAGTPSSFGVAFGFAVYRMSSAQTACTGGTGRTRFGGRIEIAANEHREELRETTILNVSR